MYTAGVSAFLFLCYLTFDFSQRLFDSDAGALFRTIVMLILIVSWFIVPACLVLAFVVPPDFVVLLLGPVGFAVGLDLLCAWFCLRRADAPSAVGH